MTTREIKCELYNDNECWKDMYKRSKDTMLKLPEARQIGIFEVMQESEQMKQDIV